MKLDVEKKLAAAQLREELIAELQRKLAMTEHDLARARESLMAVEVKLDILEGAANVLDLRTRDGVPERDREANTKASAT